MKIIDYCEALVPCWALSYLVNGDASGLGDSEIALVDTWWQQCADALPQGASLCFDYSGEEPGFCHSPAFGLAADTIPCAVWAMVSNEDTRPEIDLPEWVNVERV